jgi:predicted component of type VI protein secretion system
MRQPLCWNDISPEGVAEVLRKLINLQTKLLKLKAQITKAVLVVMLQPVVMNSTPASALCSTMKAFPLVLIVMAVLSVSGKATSVQVSVTVH